MDRVVDGGEGGRPHQGEAEHREDRSQHNEQGHEAGDRVVLQLEDVPERGRDRERSVLSLKELNFFFRKQSANFG